MVRFTVVGSLNYDLVSYTQRIPEAGETYQADSFETHVGGKGLNQTISIAKLLQKVNRENSVRLIGNVGDDEFGKVLTEVLRKEGVDTTNIGVFPNEKSGVATILVERSTGENRILIASGANEKSDYSPKSLELLFPSKENLDQEVVVFQNEIPGTKNVIEWLSEFRPQIQVVYNPSPYHSFSSNLIKFTDILIVNEGEALSVAKDVLETKEYNAFQELIKDSSIDGFAKLALALKKLINQDNSNIVVITLGSLGVVYTGSEDEAKFLKSHKVSQVIDSTGAGDTFLGAFITNYFTEKSKSGAINFAAAASSLAIQQKGASDSVPKYADVVALLNSKN